MSSIEFFMRVKEVITDGKLLGKIQSDFEVMELGDQESIANRELFTYYERSFLSVENKLQHDKARAYFLIKNIMSNNTICDGYVLSAFKENSDKGREKSNCYFNSIVSNYEEQVKAKEAGAAKIVQEANAAVVRAAQKVQDASAAKIATVRGNWKRLGDKVKDDNADFKVRTVQSMGYVDLFLKEARHEAMLYYTTVNIQYRANYGHTADACEMAYAEYNKVLTDAADGLEAKQKIVALCFNSIGKILPFPANGVAMAIGAACEYVAKVDRVEQSVSHGSFSNGFIDDATKKLTDNFNENVKIGEIIIKLRRADLKSTLVSFSNEVTSESGKVLKEHVDFCYNEDKCNNLVSSHIKSRSTTGRTETANWIAADQSKQLQTTLKAYRVKTLKAIKEVTPLTSNSITEFSPDDINNLARLIEFQLLCAYIAAVFSKNPTASISTNMIARLSTENNDVFGILAAGSDHKSAAAARRLKWDGDQNHKIVLDYFCRWFLVKIIPFGMLTGEVKIMDLLTEYKSFIDRFNKVLAIKGNRTKFLGTMTWHWDLIDKSLGADMDIIKPLKV